jgi:drug/metabolite transporter (DMT)-like permease
MSTSKSLLAPNTRNWLVLILLSLVWGTSFILIKKSLVAFSAMEVACLRMSISALAFVPLMLLRWSKIDWSRIWYLLGVGLTGTALPAIFFSTAQTQISSSLTGILNSLTPLFTLVLGIVFFQRKSNLAKIFGVLLGLGGASILILMSNNTGMEGNIWYALLVVLAAICYGTSSNLVGTYLNDMSSLTIAATSFGLVGIPGLIYLFVGTDFIYTMGHHELAWTSLGYVALLALVGTVAASVLFFRLIQWTSPIFSSTVAYLIPIVALIWGVFDGEPVYFYHFIGMALILAGVYLSRRS